MARNGFFTGLDIGTSSIKVLVAEHVNGEMNVIGVSNEEFQSILSTLDCQRTFFKLKQLKE